MNSSPKSVRTVRVEMTEEVAKTLVGLCGLVSGTAHDTYRGDTDKVNAALCKALSLSPDEISSLWARFHKGPGVIANVRKEK